MVRVAVALVFFSSPALGARLSVQVPAEVDLRRAEPCATLACDLSIGERLIHAERGLRLEARNEQFTRSQPLVFDEAFIVRSRYGGTYRIRVLAEGAGRVWLEIDPVNVAAETLVIGGAYLPSRVQVDGEPADASFRELRLLSDGTYRLGPASGRWERSENMLVLDGHYAAWGRAEVTAAGAAITFRFTRGGRLFEVVYQRADAAPIVASTR